MAFNLTFNQTEINLRLDPNSSELITTNITSETDFQFNSVEAVAVVLIIVTLVGNHLILFAFISNFKMRTVTNTMVVNMCIVDIVSVLGDIPFHLVPSMHPELSNQYVFCRVSIFVFHFSTAAGILSMFGTAVDRYLNLVQTSLRRLCREKARIIIGFVWLQALVAALPWDLLSPSSKSPDFALLICKHLPYAYSPGMDILGLSIFLKVWCVVLPYLAIVWVFGRVLQSARRRRMIEVNDSSVISRSKTERFAVHSYARSTVTAMLLFTIYLIFTTPYVVSVVYTSFSGYTNVSSTFVLWVYYIFRLKGAFLPIMYLFRNRIVIVYLQRKVKFCYRKQEYSTQTTNSMRYHGKKSSFGIVHWYRQSQRAERTKSGLSRTKYQSKAVGCQTLYTKETKKNLRSSFTDLSSVHDEKGYSTVAIERWTKAITVKEAGITDKTAKEAKSEIKANGKTGTHKPVDSQITSLSPKAETSGLSETTRYQTEIMVCTETSIELNRNTGQHEEDSGKQKSETAEAAKCRLAGSTFTYTESKEH